MGVPCVTLVRGSGWLLSNSGGKNSTEDVGAPV